MSSEEKSLNFLEEIIEKDLADGKYPQIITRFPPEPNGYLHMGHASSICLNFGLTKKYPGYTNLRFDDTNPVTEETEYVESIKNDIRWLGFEWQHELYASDYFEQLYQYALRLIRKGLAYVDDSSADEIAEQKGTPTTPGRRNAYAERSIEENERLFEEMKAGQYTDGEKVLRAKIDMGSSNMLMRDPLLYRIKHAHHHRTGDQWCIYPMYDFAHGQSDSIENITHSICTLEFVPHRELYDWLIEQLEIYPSHQYEFARRNLSYTVMSKRKLLKLVQEGYVSGWDDPRMPTISGVRRRGYPAAAIRHFCERIGIARRENMVDIGVLEFFVREELNKTAERRMVVFDPLEIRLTNLADGEEIALSGDDNPEAQTAGHRSLPFSNRLLIEQEDFMENPPKKYFRLFPGGMVRLKNAFIIKCDEVVKNADGSIAHLNCSYIPESRSGQDTSGINVKGTLHWVSAAHAREVTLNIYDRLFTVEDVDGAEGEWQDYINPNSLVVKTGYAEPALLDAAAEGTAYQFLRKGYFVKDVSGTEDRPVFNQTCTLKDSWKP